MKSEVINLDSIKLVGITIRTNNSDEMNPDTAKIAALANAYGQNNIADSIKGRITPGVTYAVYTNYDSDENGEYSYFIGEAVNSLDEQDLSNLKTLGITGSDYQKFTTNSGKMPDIIINAWQYLWSLAKTDFAAKRKYIADFEIYDSRAKDPSNAVIDIYIGIE